MQPFNEKDGGSFPLGALLRADSHRLMADESSPYASAQASGGRPSSMTGFWEVETTEHKRLCHTKLIHLKLREVYEASKR